MTMNNNDWTAIGFILLFFFGGLFFHLMHADTIGDHVTILALELMAFGLTLLEWKITNDMIIKDCEVENNDESGTDK